MDVLEDLSMEPTSWRHEVTPLLSPRGLRRASVRPWAFTLMELLVVIAILGTMMVLLIPAVLQSRESGRRVTCVSRLHSQIVALQAYHAARGAFPPGQRVSSNSETSWCLDVLPYLDEQATIVAFDRRQTWKDGGANRQVADAVIDTFRCPTSIFDGAGDTDFGGIRGSVLTSDQLVHAVDNGIMIPFPASKSDGISIRKIRDGTSHTICIAESVDRALDEGGRWISGFNCFSHDNGPINGQAGGEIFSLHRSGANVAFADGSARFLDSGVDPYLVGALCTRNHHESLTWDAL